MKMTIQAGSTPYFTVRRITIIALLSAIAIVMSIVPGIGYIYVGVIKATFMHIPVIIAAILEGPLAGAIVGMIFGISSLVINMSGPLAPVFINPMVSVVPRILIGIIAAYIYRLMAGYSHDKSFIGKLLKRLAVPLAAAAGTITNTVGVLSMIYFVAAKQFTQIKGITMGNLGKVLLGVALTNGIAELCIAVVLVTVIVKSLKSIKR